MVVGYRRHLAARSLGWETIRCEVRDVPDDRKRRQLIIENFQREDLSPVAQARAMYGLKMRPIRRSPTPKWLASWGWIRQRCPTN